MLYQDWLEFNLSGCAILLTCLKTTESEVDFGILRLPENSYGDHNFIQTISMFNFSIL